MPVRVDRFSVRRNEYLLTISHIYNYPLLQVLAPANARSVSVISRSLSGHITLISCLSATGEAIATSVIFQGMRMFKEIFEYWDIAYCANESGYQSDESFESWCIEFVQQAKPTPTMPVVLLLDNHFSHLDIDALIYLRDNNVRVVSLHPHTTHLLCAQDVCVFAPFKKYFKKYLDEARDNNEEITKYSVLKPMRKAYAEAIAITMDPLTGERHSNAITGFRKTGIYPFNVDVLTDDVFTVADNLAKKERDANNTENGLIETPQPRRTVQHTPEELERYIDDINSGFRRTEAMDKYNASPRSKKMLSSFTTSKVYLNEILAKEEAAARKVQEAIAIKVTRNAVRQENERINQEKKRKRAEDKAIRERKEALKKQESEAKKNARALARATKAIPKPKNKPITSKQTSSKISTTSKKKAIHRVCIANDDPYEYSWAPRKTRRSTVSPL